MITAGSVEALEKYMVWTFSGRRGTRELTAREAEAFALLDAAYRAEVASGE
jgi:hypothetical protein